MNLKLMSIAVGLALSAAAAQESSEAIAAPVDTTAVAEPAENVAVVPSAEVPEAEPSATEPSIATTEPPVVTTEATPSEPETKTTSETANDSVKANFDVVRGRAYNTVNNQAAAYTIYDQMSKPHEMIGNKLVYMEPTMEFAAVAFGDSSNTYFLGLQNSSNLGLLRAGFATKSFGIQVYAAFGKSWVFRDEPNRETSETRIAAGDLLGGIFSMPLGDLDLTVQGHWLTTSNERTFDVDSKSGNDTENEQDYWDVNLRGTVSNSPAKDKKISWAAGATLLRHNRTEKEVADKEETTRATLDTRWQLEPFFSVGFAPLKTNNARVLLGLNTRIPVQLYDEIANKNTDTRKNHIATGIFTSPNILAELALGNCWLIFGGATYEWNAFSTEYLYEANSDVFAMATKSESVTVNAGARFQYKNYAVEVSISDAFFNNPIIGFHSNAFLANLGGFIHF